MTCVPPFGICFLSDPQLRAPEAQTLAEEFLAAGGRITMTGTPEHGSYSEALLQAGKMD